MNDSKNEKLLPITEAVNPATAHIDRMTTLEMARAINQQDRLAAEAVEKTLPSIAQAIDGIAQGIGRGGRLIYAGAGTSGRLGVLDASECPPTYGVPPSMVRALIAGGDRALRNAVEGAEDDAQAGRDDLDTLSPTKNDTLVGLSAGGGAPYVLGMIQRAKEMGMLTVGITCNPQGALATAAQIAIVPVVGPEVIAGSSRMKAGTAQKMVLNMLSTGVMVKLGKVYGNLMVDMRASNEKLRLRALRMVRDAAGVGEERAELLLGQARGDTRLAIFMGLSGLPADAAAQALGASGGHIGQAIDALRAKASLKPE